MVQKLQLFQLKTVYLTSLLVIFSIHIAIPSSSNFSSETSPPIRPPRRSQQQQDTTTDGWFDDYDNSSSSSSSSSARPPPPRNRSNNNRSNNNSGVGRSSSRGSSSSGSSSWDIDDDNSSNLSSSSSSSSWDINDGDKNDDDRSVDYNESTTNNNNRGRGRGGGGGGGRGGNRNREYSNDRGGGRRGGRGGGGGRREYDTRSGGGRGGRGRGSGGRGGGRFGDNKRQDNKLDDGAVKMNLKLIENAGYQHIYGIAPVLNALKANVRDFSNPEERENEELKELKSRLLDNMGIDADDEDEEDDRWAAASENDELEQKKKKKIIKPEAQTSPHLFIQEGTFDNNKRSFRSNAKVEASSEIVSLAKEYELPIVEVDKGVLNTLCGNRPHQGFVLRCGGRDFESLRKLPSANNDSGGGPKVWLALDEVVDPQNLGALLRSAYFLGRGASTINDNEDDNNIDIGKGDVGILVCSKNSSPLTPTVSAASAGALEFMTIYSTSNLPRLLNGAKEDGWRILGAAAEVPEKARVNNKNGELALGLDDAGWELGEDDETAVVANDESTKVQQEEQQHFELHKVDSNSPTILVLGSEGRGLRTLVARSCTGFVSIPGGISGVGSGDDGDSDDTQAGVDSLNVSVTGGILLWHFLSKL